MSPAHSYWPLLLCALALACRGPARVADPPRQPRPVAPTKASADPKADAESQPTSTTALPGPRPRKRRCSLESRTWYLDIDIKRPRKRSYRQTSKLLATVLNDTSLLCIGERRLVAGITTREAREIFGRHVTFHCVPGAGNRVDAPAYSAGLKPERHVPARFRPHVRRFTFNNDPKYSWDLDSSAKDCKAVFGESALTRDGNDLLWGPKKSRRRMRFKHRVLETRAHPTLPLVVISTTRDPLGDKFQTVHDVFVVDLDRRRKRSLTRRGASCGNHRACRRCSSLPRRSAHPSYFLWKVTS